MKRFLYLFQVEQDLPDDLEQIAGPDSDVFFLSYGAKSGDPRSVFYPSSSWTQGRNRLLKEVMDRPYLYFVFGDADVRLEFTRRGRRGRKSGRDPWRAFEDFLLEYEPAVGVPAYFWHRSGSLDEDEAVQTLRFFDPVLNAFHAEAMSTVLPYYDLMDEASTDYSGSILCSIAAELYPGHVLQTNDVRVLNPLSLRAYTERILAKPETFYLESLRDPAMREDYRRQPLWGRLPHPGNGTPSRKHRSYGITEEELGEVYRLDHPLWARMRELVEMPKDSDFFEESRETERAQRWRRHNPGRIPPPAWRMSRVVSALRPLLVRLGLVRTGRLYATLRRVVQAYHHAAILIRRWKRGRRRPGARELWMEWRAHADQVYGYRPEEQSRLFDLLGYVHNRIRDPSTLFVDIGTCAGETLAGVEDPTLTGKPVISLGIDPVQDKGFSWYVAYVLGTVGEDALRLSTVLRQYGLHGRTVHYLRIAVGDVESAYRTLDGHEGECLFLTIRASQGEPDTPALAGSRWPEVRAGFEGFGFRLLNLVEVEGGPLVEATFVNTGLLGRLLSELADA